MKLQKSRQKTVPPAPDLLPAVIESLLFVAVEPQEIATIAKTLNVPKRQVEKAVELLIGMTEGRGVFVQRLGDSVQLATVPDAGPYIEQFLEMDYGRLSRASLETLAIVAYRPPMTRATIESIRGVNSDHAVTTLLARGLIEEVGRAPGPGRPTLFAGTHRFLEYFGLQRSEDLPALPEIEQLEEAAGAVQAVLAETNGNASGETGDMIPAELRAGEEPFAVADDGPATEAAPEAVAPDSNGSAADEADE
ncbi:MAG: SMC-Scp complex subunit ScpB, partial [Chloroflexi bacterium]|nr:SMC-Scp complex subunit ScpB [Chloroflexota bacterium]